MFGYLWRQRSLAFQEHGASPPKICTRFTRKSIVRAALEDKTMLDEFDGYKDDTQQLPYRLTPQIL
jgi:hypothetical protein